MAQCAVCPQCQRHASILWALIYLSCHYHSECDPSDGVGAQIVCTVLQLENWKGFATLTHTPAGNLSHTHTCLQALSVTHTHTRTKVSSSRHIQMRRAHAGKELQLQQAGTMLRKPTIVTGRRRGRERNARGLSRVKLFNYLLGAEEMLKCRNEP